MQKRNYICNTGKAKRFRIEGRMKMTMKGRVAGDRPFKKRLHGESGKRPVQGRKKV